MVPTMNGGRLGATLKQNFVQLYVCILNGFLFHVFILFLFLNHECIFHVKKIKGRKERKKKEGGKAGKKSPIFSSSKQETSSSGMLTGGIKSNTVMVQPLST